MTIGAVSAAIECDQEFIGQRERFPPDFWRLRNQHKDDMEAAILAVDPAIYGSDSTVIVRAYIGQDGEMVFEEVNPEDLFNG